MRLRVFVLAGGGLSFIGLGVQPTYSVFADEHGDGYVKAGAGRVIVVGPAHPAERTSAPLFALPPADPFALISQESLFGLMEDLTAIQPYSGWRNSATEGEAATLDYVTETLRQ